MYKTSLTLANNRASPWTQMLFAHSFDSALHSLFFFLKSCTLGSLTLPDETPSNKAMLSSLSLRWTNTPYTGQESFACLLGVNIKWNSTWLGKSAEKLKSKIEPPLAIIPKENGKTLQIIGRYKGSLRMDTMQTKVSLLDLPPLRHCSGKKHHWHIFSDFADWRWPKVNNRH